MSPASAWLGRANLWSSHLSYSVLSWTHLCSPPDLLFHSWILLGCGCRSAVDRVIFIACIQDLTFHTRQYQKVKILLALVFLSVYPFYILLHYYSSFISTFIIFVEFFAFFPAAYAGHLWENLAYFSFAFCNSSFGWGKLDKLYRKCQAGTDPQVKQLICFRSQGE